MANIQVAGTSSRGLREYRKGNWTIEETMVLIEAKKLDEERRLTVKRDQTSSSSNIEGGGLMNMVRSKPAAAAELRWKWIEDYCWTKSCLRSQNQCNDKWDNLMRDFKKVRDYENSCTNNNVNSSECCSYWKMERRERKDKNLPSNILPQIYEALVQVMERKGGQRGVNVNVNVMWGATGSSCAATTTTSSINPNMSFVMQTPPTSILQQQQYLSSQPLHLPLSAPIAALPLPPLPSPPPPLPQLPLPTVDNTETSSDHQETNNSDTPSKRRRGGGRRRISHAITKSASVIAEAVQASEESEERRHRDLMSVQQRRLQIEETKAEIHKQGINGLTDAINKLANSIHALANSHNQPPNPPT